MKSLTYAALRETTREREGEEGSGLGGGRRTKEVEKLSWLFPSWEIMMKLPPLGSLYIVGMGCTLPLPQGTREVAKGG
jgi:hypothetical protein